MCADFAGTRDVGLMNRAKSIVLFPALGNSALGRKWHTLFCELGLLSSNVLVHPSDYLLVPELRQSSIGYGKRILGIPVGSDEYRSQCLSDIIAKLRQEFERVAELDDPQLEMCFLRVIMRTKVVHLLRGLYPSEGLELARAYDLM
jgi:hypothetical protein